MHADCYVDGYSELDWAAYDGQFQMRDMQRGLPLSKDDPLPSNGSSE
jgi:hypothetical protein